LLDLDYNRIGDEGAEALGEAIKTNPSITKLNLNRNQIGDEGAIALAEALQTNTSITALGLYGNQIENKKVFEDIKAYLARNKERQKNG